MAKKKALAERTPQADDKVAVTEPVPQIPATPVVQSPPIVTPTPIPTPAPRDPDEDIIPAEVPADTTQEALVIPPSPGDEVSTLAPANEPIAPPSNSLNNLQASTLLSYLKKIDVQFALILSQSKYHIKDNTIYIDTEQHFTYNSLQQKQHLVSQKLESEYQLNVVFDIKLTQKEQPVEQDSNKLDKTIQDIVDIFNGEIVEKPSSSAK